MMIRRGAGIFWAGFPTGLRTYFAFLAAAICIACANQSLPGEIDVRETVRLRGSFSLNPPQIVLTWTPVTGRTISYVVFRGTTPATATEVTLRRWATIATTQFVDRDVRTERRHFYRVAPVRNGIEGAFSNRLEITPETTPGPATPRILSAPPEVTNRARVEITFQAPSTRTAAFACRLDHGPPFGCASPLHTRLAGEGEHAVSIFGRDGVGRRSPPVTTTWVLDTIPPETQIASGPPPVTASPTAGFAFQCDDPPCTYACRLNGAPVACAKTTTIGPLPLGAHLLTVAARDTASNRDPTPAVTTWIIDDTKPFSGRAQTAAPAADHLCVIALNGTLWCWGDGTDGKLGNGGLNATTIPTRVGVESDWSAIATGRQHTCGIRANEHLLCWGSHALGQAGLGPSAPLALTQPSAVSPETAWRTVAAGSFHACALANDTQTACWGFGQAGRLGTGGEQNRSTPVTNITQADKLALGAGHSCSRGLDGALRCWGSNTSGQLGIGTANNATTPTPVALASPVTPAAGGEHTCTIDQDGTGWCWGNNLSGQLGTGDLLQRQQPTPIAGESSWRALAAGGNHTCGIAQDQTLYCWGDNAAGQLGVPETTPIPSPRPVTTAAAQWQSVSAGATATCAIDTDHTLWCWGTAAFLGNAGSRDPAAPRNFLP